MKKKLALSAFLILLFVLLILAVQRVDVTTVELTGKTIGLSKLNKTVHRAMGTHLTLYKATQYLGYASILLAAGFGCVGALQWFRRRSLKKVDSSLWALAGLYAVTAAVYVLFEKVVINYRPILMPGQTEAAASFPSTHTVLFSVILGSTAIMAGRYLRSERLRQSAVSLCVLAALAGVVWRLVSGVHWLTDIVGGVLISAALLLAFSAALDRLDQTKRSA